MRKREIKLWVEFEKFTVLLMTFEKVRVFFTEAGAFGSIVEKCDVLIVKLWVSNVFPQKYRVPFVKVCRL